MRERIRKEIYAPANYDIDEFALLQAQCSRLIFSYRTALYIWGLTDIIPHIFDVLVLHGENISILLRDNKKIRAHYIAKEFYSLGITAARSPQGAAIRLYDRERCLCDLIKDKHQIEKQLYVQAIKEYFKA